MKILSCCPLGYYSRAASVSYEYVSFVEVPRLMGHRVHHFEYRLMAAAGREQMNEFFVETVARGGYDLVMVLTLGDELLPEALDEARRHAPLMAWNTDDDWRWAEYSSRYAPHYTYMVTTYRRVYEANRAAHPNLLLSQWGCTGLREGIETPKDLGISFAGAAYGARAQEIERLRREVGLAAYGRYVRAPDVGATWLKRRLARALRIPMQEPNLELPSQEAVKDLWNRSRISFTPLEASRGAGRQIKARVFDMGLSGTVMLCSKNPDLHEYYEPGAEFVEYETMDECVEKAKYLLSHEDERRQIAQRYYARTMGEHLWRQRFEKLFAAMGVGKG